MTVNSKEKAWMVASDMMTYDFEYDVIRSANAGYGIYYTVKEGVNEWVSDLGNRLELNLASGETVNVWIEERHPLEIAMEKLGWSRNQFGEWVIA